MKRYFELLICIIFILTITGCSMSAFETDRIMESPKLTDEYGEIQSFMKNNINEDFILETPKDGDYKSSILLRENFTVVFYKLNNKDDTIYILFLKKINDYWTQIKTFAEQNYQIEKVCFGDVDADGQEEIIVTWILKDDISANIIVYDVDDNKVEQSVFSMEEYSQMTVMDFNNDNIDEIFVVRFDRKSQKNYAKLLEIKSHKFTEKGKEISIASIFKGGLISSGCIDKDIRGVLLDTKTSNSYPLFGTDVIYWDDKENSLVDPFAGDFSKIFAKIFYNEKSKDVDGDGIIEIPFVKNINKKNITKDLDPMVYLITWNKYKIVDKKYSEIISYIFNCKENYKLKVPDKWIDKSDDKFENEIKVVAQLDSKERTMQISTSSENLFKIKVFNDSDWVKNSEENLNYIEIGRINKRIYAVTDINLNNELSLNIDEIKNLFSLS